jgi:hypothetical protein
MPADRRDYEQLHADRRNLIIHLLAVPAFDLAFPLALIVLVRGEFVLAALCIFAAIGSMALQGLGHSMEAISPRPFSGPYDFLRRWFAEQFIRFPAFVLTGRWRRQYQAEN